MNAKVKATVGLFLWGCAVGATAGYGVGLWSGLQFVPKDQDTAQKHWERGFELGKKVRDHDAKAGVVPALDPRLQEDDR